MKPTLRTLFIFNNCEWTTVQEKIEWVKSFFSPKVDMQIDVKFSHYASIPFEGIQGLSGSYNHEDAVITTQAVTDSWYDLNITSQAVGYDIVLFHITDADKIGHITSTGIRTDKDQGPVECTVFGLNEHDHAYQNGVDLGDVFSVFASHELSHAIYMLFGVPDNTHKYFYGAIPSKVLEDFNFPVPNNADRVNKLHQLLNYCIQLLGLLKQKQAMIDTQPKTSQNDQMQPTSGQNASKVDLFCHAIQDREGYIAPCTDYPKGTPAWRNKNPGNARYVGQFGAVGKDGSGFAIFPTYEVGYEYLYKVVENTCKGLSKVRGADYTIAEFFAGTPAKKYQDGYSPLADNNNPASYAAEVAHKVGVPVETHMKDLLT